MKSWLKYFAIVLVISLFAVCYIWQNIEVMKIKMDYRKYRDREKALVKDIDRYRYLIERSRRGEVIDRYAQAHGLRQVTPADIDVIRVEKK